MTDDDWASDIHLERTQSQLRTKCHDLFDPLWKQGGLSRKVAYRLLAQELGVCEQEAHFGWMGVEKLEAAIPAILALRSRYQV